MPGGIHPPLSVILSWPTPNYIDPITRPNITTVLACVFGPVTILLIFARLWVRIRLQQNAALDDWLMIAASVGAILSLRVFRAVNNTRYHLLC
jgi:hypothetical protein